MPGSWNPLDHPHLSVDNHAITSPESRKYNCIAWANGEVHRRWEPDPLSIHYWPSTARREITLDAVVHAFGTRGYHPCKDGALKPGVEKIALFGKSVPGGRIYPTHAARQLPNGKWTSKLGDYEDIEHSTEGAVSGPLYGTVVRYLERVAEKGPEKS